jgi:hypothetical protein
MRLWEAERHPNVSVLRATPDQDITALGHGFLLLGSLAELAQLRGFKYFVILNQETSLSPPDQGPHWDTIVGFCNDPEPNMAREFPEYYKPSQRYEVYPAAVRERAASGGAEVHVK